MARAIPRVPEAERGKSDTRPNSRSQAWKRDERSIAKWFQEHDGINTLFTRLKLTTSTGRIGHLTWLQMDSVSKHYCVEVKRRESAPVWLTDAWAQINQIGDEQRLSPALVLCLPRETYTVEGADKKLPPLHCITPERHLHLLACEKRCEELDAGHLTK